MFNNMKKTILIVYLLCLLIMILSALNQTNVFEMTKRYFFEPGYKENFDLEESHIKREKDDMNRPVTLIEVISSALDGDWRFDYMIIFGTNYFQLLLPCITSLAGVFIFIRNKTIYNYSIYRNKIYKNYLKSEILRNSLLFSITIFLSYITFFVLIFYITKGKNTDYLTRTLFIDIIGNSFYYNHTHLYYFLDGCIRFLLIPFVYSFFSSTVALLCQSMKKMLFMSNIYYYGMCAIGFVFYFLFGDIALYINPSVIMASGSYSYINTLLLLLFSMVPIVIGGFLLKNKEKYDIY